MIKYDKDIYKIIQTKRNHRGFYLVLTMENKFMSSSWWISEAGNPAVVGFWMENITVVHWLTTSFSSWDPPLKVGTESFGTYLSKSLAQRWRSEFQAQHLGSQVQVVLLSIPEYGNRIKQLFCACILLSSWHIQYIPLKSILKEGRLGAPTQLHVSSYESHLQLDKSLLIVPSGKLT
jgi:hypothetical protein